MRIAVDMDEVLADAHAAKLSLYRARGLDVSDDALRGRKLSDIAPADMTASVEAEMQRGFFFANLDVIDGAVPAMKALVARHEVFVATAAMEYPASCPHKLAWLAKHFPFVDPLNVVFCGDKSVLAVDVLIDDSPRHFETFAGAGVCFAALHNEGSRTAHRLEHWDEADGLLDRVEKELAA